MKPELLSEWVLVGARIFDTSPDRFAEVLETLKEAAGAQELIAAHDDQLFLRAQRPGKLYQA